MSSGSGYNHGINSPNESSPLIMGNASRRFSGSLSSNDSSIYGSRSSAAIYAHSPPPTPNSELVAKSRRKRNKIVVSEEYKPPESISGVELRLMNIGSVARDHLSSERTFLGYVRTSLGLSSAGVALIQFLYLGHNTKVYAAPLGSALIITGLIVLFIGTKRYFQVQRTLVTGYFPPSSVEVALISFLLGALIAATFGIIMVGRTK